MTVSRYLLPILVAAALYGGFALRTALTHPTTQTTFSAVGSEKVVCTVEGLKCKGTAAFFTKMFADTPGIGAIETFASEHKAVIYYDPDLITPAGIKAVIETAVPMRDGSHQAVFKCLAMK
jgi:hypothetical protein